MSEEKQLKELSKIESKFEMIEKYYCDITKERDKRKAELFIKRVQLDKIIENRNKVQNIHYNRICDNSLF